LRVLIVDSDTGVSEALKEGMEEYCSASVTRAESGAVATHALRTEPIDLAVIDGALPDISSFELAERAADLNVPVLLISGHPNGHEICRTNGYPWLAKPFSLAALATAAMHITHAAGENIARIHQAYARLEANLDRREHLMADANRLVGESRDLKAQSAAARRKPTPRGD
jgi:DNA-binding response OmpR family regulator